MDLSEDEICKTLKELNIGVAKRLLSGDIFLYREPKLRFKKDGTPAITVVTPWLDMTSEQAKHLAVAILTTIDSKYGQGLPIFVK